MSLRVLVVDDSAFMRRILTRMLGAAAGIEVVGSAADGNAGLVQVKMLHPDVVTLDVEMPGADGLEALRGIMEQAPTPVVMVSSLTTAHAATTLEALALGAVDFVAKPSAVAEMPLVQEELVRKVRAAAQARPRPRRPETAGPPQWTRQTWSPRGYGLIVIGCSTGGPQALRQVLAALPGDLPAPLIVVQHMPAGFTALLAQRLDRESPLRVREAADGDRLEPGLALVAPGGRHLIVRSDGRVAYGDGRPEHGVRPAVDVTLRSVLAVRGGDAVVAVLTGMGLDGAEGARRIHEAGGYVLCEAEESAVVYGMPRATWELGGADRQVRLQDMAAELVAAQQRGRRMRA